MVLHSTPSFCCFLIIIIITVSLQRNRLSAKSGPHVRWELVKSPSKCCVYWQCLTQTEDRVARWSYIPPQNGSSGSKDLKCFHYLNSGFILSLCFLCNPFRGLGLAHLDSALIPGTDYQSHLEFALTHTFLWITREMLSNFSRSLSCLQGKG